MTSTPPHQGSKRRRIDDLDLRAVETGWTEYHFHPSRETLFGSFETAIGFLKEKDPVMFHVSIPVDGEALRKVPRLEDTHRKLGVNAEAKKYLLAGYHLGFHVMKTLFEITQPGEEWDKGKAQLNASIDKAESAITNPLNVLALEGILIAFHAFEAVEMQRRQERAGGGGSGSAGGGSGSVLASGASRRRQRQREHSGRKRKRVATPRIRIGSRSRGRSSTRTKSSARSAKAKALRRRRK
jgi:hypothetical protein